MRHRPGVSSGRGIPPPPPPRKSAKWSYPQLLFQIVGIALAVALLCVIVVQRSSPNKATRQLRQPSMPPRVHLEPDDERHAIYHQTIVTLRTTDGRYVEGDSRELPVRPSVKATYVDTVHQLVLEKKFAGWVHHGDNVWLRHYSSTRYFDSDPKTTTIRARWTDKGDFQKMTIFKVNNTADTRVHDDDLVRFRVIPVSNATGSPERYISYSADPQGRSVASLGMTAQSLLGGSGSSTFRVSVDHTVLPNSQPSDSVYSRGYHYSQGRNFVESAKCVITPPMDQLFKRTNDSACKARMRNWHCGNVAGLSRFRVEYPAKSQSLRCADRSGVPKDHEEKIQPPGSAADVTVGYVILAAPNEGSAVFELLSQLYHTQDTFAIHIDSKNPTKAVKLTKKLKKKYPRGNLVVLSTRSITWGGFSMLLAELDALTALLKLGRKFEYVINLSATAFPIKTRAGIQQGLSNWHTTNHLELFKQDDKALHARGSRHWFVECAEAGRVFRMPGIKPMLSGVGFFGGSQWFVLRREFVAEVMKCLQRKIPGDEDRCTYIRDILESHRFSLISDETFLQTVSMASPYCHQVKPTSLHWVAWDRTKKKKRPDGGCLHGDVVDWCGTSPGLVKGNIGFMTQRSSQLFARKFSDDDVASRSARLQIKAYLTAQAKQELEDFVP